MNVNGWGMTYGGRIVKDVDRLESGQLLLKVYDRKQRCLVDEFIDLDEVDEFADIHISRAEDAVARVESNIEDLYEEINERERDLDACKTQVKMLTELFAKN